MAPGRLYALGVSFPPPSYGGPPLPPPGWHFDHGSQRWLWWDGGRWVAPVDPGVPAGPADAAEWFPTTPTLQLPAAVAGIAFIVVLTVLTRLADLLPQTPAAFAQLALFAVSTVGMPLAAWYGSRRWGTGSIVDDLGLRFRWIDVPLGVAGAIVLTVALMVFNVVTHLVGVPSGSNLTEVSDRGRDVVTFAVLFVTAGLMAPITEELLFRGMILRGLSSRWTMWAAVGLQAAVFGAAHFTPTEGWGNFDLTVSLAIMGFGLGAIARLTGRLGTGMIAHGVFNCVQLALLWLTLR